MTETTEQEQNEQDAFNESLRAIAEVLKKNNVDISVVGGMAIKGMTGEQISPRRPNGTSVDFDAVALGPDKTTIKKTLEILAQQEKNHAVFPEIGIEPIAFSDSPLRFPALATLSSIRKDSNGKYFLSYRSVEVEIPPETMETKDILINGIPFPCFPAKTILFRYLVRGGQMKRKDRTKLRKFQDYIIEHWDQEPNDQLYHPYLEFAERVRKKHPRAVWVYNFYWQVDDFTGGKISGSRGFIYDFIQHLRAES